MGRTTGRSPEDTRRLLLNSAGQVIRTRGLNATLDDIARHAGVSKGGLLYHFSGKDDLVMALAEDLLAVFRTEVDGFLDPADVAPGRLTRAYVRALFDPAQDEAAARDSIALIAQLMTVPAVADLARADAARFDADLAADGLPAAVTALVVAAADGVGSRPMWGGSIQSPQHRRLEQQLIELTHRPGLWEDLPLT